MRNFKTYNLGKREIKIFKTFSQVALFPYRTVIVRTSQCDKTYFEVFPCQTQWQTFYNSGVSSHYTN
jgi:hypothetical protein